MSLDAFLAEIGDVAWSRAPAELKRKSKDYFWFSPVLSDLLKDCEAEVIVSPRSRDELVTVAGAAARSGIALTARGGGTGNYGQAVPLHGGAVLDMTGLSGPIAIADGVARVAAGSLLYDLEQALRSQGHELRMFPSTWRTATIGGFVAGGTGGVGSVSWGGLREPGNLIEATVVTVEETPRILTLEGSDCNLVNRTFGTTGLIAELVIPVQPAVDWWDVLVTFDDLAAAIDFGAAICHAKGLQKRLCSVSDERIARFYKPFAALIPEAHSITALMLAPSSLIAVREMAAQFGGTIVLERPSREAEEDPALTPIYEIAFNHSTQHVLRRARNHTYLQSLYPSADVLLGLRDQLGDEVMWHVEFIGFDGGYAMNGLPVLRYSSPERLNEVIALHEAAGAPVANPHVVTVEDGSRYKRLSGDQLGFKHDVDPAGLLNPGKMRTFVPAKAA